MHPTPVPAPATPDQKADHLRRLLDCDHVRAACFTGTVMRRDPDGRIASGNYWDRLPLADVAQIGYQDANDHDRDTYAPLRPAEWAPDTLPQDAIAILDYTCYSDYSGCSVERANERAIREMFPNADWLKDLYGGHGSSGLAVDLAAWLDTLTEDDDPHALLETVEGLDDYPAVSDEAVSELETEAEDEALPDLYKDLARTVPWDRCERLHDYLSDLPEDRAHACYRAAMEATNTYPEHETGGSVYFDVKRIRASYIRAALALRHLPAGSTWETIEQTIDAVVRWRL